MDHVVARLRTKPGVGTGRYVSLMTTRRHWAIVASHDHARRGVIGGFVMANHGKRSPLARMSPGDGVLIYSPTTTYPHGEPLRAVTIVGEVTGDGPEPSDLITGGFRRAAKLREIEPLPLEEIRTHLPLSRIRSAALNLTRRMPKRFGRSWRTRVAEQGPDNLRRLTGAATGWHRSRNS